MANMTYCRFVNTLEDLCDCYEHMDDKKDEDGEPLSSEEQDARKKLIALCATIAGDFGEEEG